MATKKKFKIFFCFHISINRCTSPNNDNSSESESDGSTSDSSDSSNNVSKVESTTNENRKWVLSSFIKPEIQAKQQLLSVPLDPLPDSSSSIKPEPFSSSPVRFGAPTSIQAIVDQSHSNAVGRSLLSPLCTTNEQIKLEPIGKSFTIISICKSN